MFMVDRQSATSDELKQLIIAEQARLKQLIIAEQARLKEEKARLKEEKARLGEEKAATQEQYRREEKARLWEEKARLGEEKAATQEQYRREGKERAVAWNIEQKERARQQEVMRADLLMEGLSAYTEEIEYRNAAMAVQWAYIRLQRYAVTAEELKEARRITKIVQEVTCAEMVRLGGLANNAYQLEQERLLKTGRFKPKEDGDDALLHD
jgi:hypothetical protein